MVCGATGPERRPTEWSGAVRMGDLAGLWPGGPRGPAVRPGNLYYERHAKTQAQT